MSKIVKTAVARCLNSDAAKRGKKKKVGSRKSWHRLGQLSKANGYRPDSR